MSRSIVTVVGPAVLLTLAFSTHDLHAADAAAAETISLAEGKLTLTAPAGWTRKEPKFRNIVLYEFAAPKAEGDNEDGRATVGPAGGELEANQNRWLAQFKQPDGSKTADRAKRREKDVAGSKVHILDISGTYAPPPFAGGGTFPDYRMLAAVIVTPQNGSWYVRLYGPEKTIASQADAFDKMIDSLQVK
jgi:hypothetical protein